MTITTRQLQGFMASHRRGLDGVGFNDTWNMQHFGITREQDGIIRRAMMDEYGLPVFWPTKPTLARINARIQNGY